ncbi:hypothetical protein MC885_014685 [Smutsia gigantea]|nr:hypothetical protein MC885_014685 [Smutsia gigantea]
MSELPADCSIPHTDAENGHRDVPQAEVGGGPREPARARPEEPGEGPMAAAREVSVAAAGAAGMAEVARVLAEPAEEEGQESRSRSRPGNGPGLAASPHRLHLPPCVLEITYWQVRRLYHLLHLTALGGMQVLECRGSFVEDRRAREAAFDADYPRNPQRMDGHILTSTIALTASEVIDPLVEDLGCDKFINRE